MPGITTKEKANRNPATKEHRTVAVINVICRRSMNKFRKNKDQ
jgi:hypothetical protein